MSCVCLSLSSGPQQVFKITQAFPCEFKFSMLLAILPGRVYRVHVSSNGVTALGFWKLWNIKLAGLWQNYAFFATHFNPRFLAGMCQVFEGKTPLVFLGDTVLPVNFVGGFCARTSPTGWNSFWTDSGAVPGVSSLTGSIALLMGMLMSYFSHRVLYVCLAASFFYDYSALFVIKSCIKYETNCLTLALTLTYTYAAMFRV